jgi:hypothetical protein
VLRFDDGVLIGAGRALAKGVDWSYLCDVAGPSRLSGPRLGHGHHRQAQGTVGRPQKIILYANPGKEGFYKKLGFTRMRTAMAIFEDQDRAIRDGLVDGP